MAAGPAAPRARRLAIVRLTSLGDVIHTLPLAAAIKHHEPNARVIWLAEERERVVLDDNPAVDEVIVVPIRRWRLMGRRPAGLRQATREFRELRRQLRALELDAAIDVQGWPHKTSPLGWFSRAPLRIGFSRAFARHPLATLFTTVHVTPTPAAKHIVDQNLALLEPLAIPQPSRVEFPMPRFADADRWAEGWWREHQLHSRRVVALLPSTRGAAKLWSIDAFRALGRRILDDDPNAVVLSLGGPGEEARLNATIDGLPAGRALALAPGPIAELVGILRRVDVAIGNDTGPIHITAAADVPSLGLFGPTRGERNGPYGPLSRFIQSPSRSMDDISVDVVWDVLKQLPAKPAPTRR